MHQRSYPHRRIKIGFEPDNVRLSFWSGHPFWKEPKMNLFPISGVNFFSQDSRRNGSPAFTRIAAFAAAILKLRSHAERAGDFVAARYEGQAWCDATERRLNDDMR
jgi:hypothetical protein